MPATAKAGLMISSRAREAERRRDPLSRRKIAARARAVKAPRLGSSSTKSPIASLAISSRSTKIQQSIHRKNTLPRRGLYGIDMIYRLYEHILLSRISKGNIPGCVAVVLSSGDLSGEGSQRLCDLIDWSRSLGLRSLALYVSDDTPNLCLEISALLRDAQASVSLHTADGAEQTGLGGPFNVVISLGYGASARWLRHFEAFSRRWRAAA